MAIATLFRRSTGKAAGRSRTVSPTPRPARQAAERNQAAERTEALRPRGESERNGISRNATFRDDAGRVDTARMEQAEDRLIAKAIENHPRRDLALDRLADDIAGHESIDPVRREPLLLRSTASLNRAEELLLQAIIHTHPNGERALDRLLEDVSPEFALDDTPSLPPDFVDMDYDGLG